MPGPMNTQETIDMQTHNAMMPHSICYQFIENHDNDIGIKQTNATPG